jgi:uncharacterized protein
MKIFNRKHYLDKIIPHIGKNIIKIMSGMRRSGKSIILKQISDYITQKSINKNNIVFIDKELDVFDKIKNADDLTNYIESQFKNIEGNKYIFIDEIQLIESWEKVINSYLKQEQYDIYITGSNSSMLSSELSTLIAGRYINIDIYPLTFNEYYEFSGSKFNTIEEAFEYYLRYGGMPYLLCYTKNQLEDDIIYQYLKAVYNTVVLKDIIQRHSIRDSSELERIASYMFDNTGSLTTANNISKYLKSTGSSLTVTSVINYIKYFIDTYLMHKCQRYDINGEKLLTVNSKYYANDIGLISGVLGYSGNRINGILENIVYIELLKRGYNIKVGYINGNEVDFLAEKRNNRLYIQVTYQLGSPEGSTYEREYRPLLAIKDNYPKYILSTEGKIAGKGERGIKRMNIVDFLLSSVHH